ncbi:MAG TPA: tetratricopeptide repeat protein [Stenomitos sp.]
MKQFLKISIFTLLGFGIAALAYGIWLSYQDDQILQEIQAQETAIARYRKETKQHPQDPQAQLKLGNAAMAFWQKRQKITRLSLESGGMAAMNWMMANPLQEAVTAYRAALKLNPQLADAQIGLCQAMLEQDKKDQEATVTATCRQSTVLKPQSADSYLALGVALTRQMQWAEAEAMFRKYLSLTDDKGNAYYQLGKALLGQQKYDEAIGSYRQAIQLSPRSNLSYEGLGDALKAQGKTEEAITAYRNGLNVEPKYPPIHIKLGDLFMQEKQFEEAITTYRQFSEVYPNIASSYAGLGRVRTAQQKWDEAIAAFNKAIELDDQDAWTYKDRGVMYTKQNKLDAAIADYSKAIALEPTNIFSLIERGIVYARQGKSKSAIKDLNRAVQLEPNSVTALNALCWNGNLMGLTAQVISACDKVVTVAKPQEKDFYRDSRGLARAMAGDHQGAIADFQAFIRWTSSNTTKDDYEVSDLRKRIARRQAWIQSLQKHQNPFTPGLRQALFNE